MKTRKSNKKEIDARSNEDERQSKHQRKKIQRKVKYRHQNHWLQEEDVDYHFPKYKDEEE